MAALALLAGCGSPARHGDPTPGDRLEASARALGLVADPARASPVGLFARGEDRLCVVPGAGAYQIGVLVRFEDAQGCLARGTATRSGERLDVDLGQDGGEDCRFPARFDGDRITFPAVLPAGCDRRCTGRASLSAIAADRLSDGADEAAAQDDGRGAPLCGS